MFSAIFGTTHVWREEPYNLLWAWFNAYLGGVYMTPWRLSPRSEFNPLPSHGSIFVYMIPPQNVMPTRVTPVLVPGREFHLGTKSRNGIM